MVVNVVQNEIMKICLVINSTPEIFLQKEVSENG